MEYDSGGTYEAPHLRGTGTYEGSTYEGSTYEGTYEA